MIMSGPWFIADPHFGHANIIRYCHRPYSSVGEMDRALIANWNALVRPTDMVYVVGDVARDNTQAYLAQLNGRKTLIFGHHDRHLESLRSYFEEITPFKQITIDGQDIVLCHYPLMDWPGREQGAWQLHGHKHGTYLSLEAKQWDVGVDVNDYQPISFMQIKDIMSKRIETRRPAAAAPFGPSPLQVKCQRRWRTPVSLKSRHPRLSR